MQHSKSAMQATGREALPWAGLAHLLVVYLVWGSTYLAIRIAVREGAGFPPFTMAAMRMLVAGGLLLSWTALTGRRLSLSRRELAVLAVSGTLLWLGGNGLVVWAEQRAHSGYAALLVGSMPIWVAVMESGIDRRPPTPLFMVALLVGLTGVGLLTAPALQRTDIADVASAVALLFAAITWGAGSLLQRRRPVAVAPLVSAGYQSVIGGATLALVAVLVREPLPMPTAEAWWAWGYLVVFGSLVAFTSYVKALGLLPTNIVMTYPYVNPVIAVFLGWFMLQEPITLWTISGMALVLLGVAGVFREQQSRARNT